MACRLREKTMAETITLTCPICKNKYETTRWKMRTGILKGQTTIKSGFCSKECRAKFNSLITRRT